MRICKVEGCGEKHRAKGYCNRHYQQILRNGVIGKTRFDKNKITTKGDICYMEICDKNQKTTCITKFNKKHFHKVSKIKWHIDSLGYIGSSKNTRLGNSKIRLHRLIKEDEIKDKLVVDHIDRDRLNNLDNNLRVVTNRDNIINNNQKCFCWVTRRKKWMVKLKGTNRKEKFIGYFKTKKEAKQKAYKVRKQRYLEIFGEVETFIN